MIERTGVRSMGYVVSREGPQTPHIVATGESSKQAESEAYDELAFFMDRVVTAYSKNGLYNRAKSAQSFFERHHYISHEQLHESVRYFAHELIDSYRIGEAPVIAHISADDVKDQRVGSSEYIVSLLYDNLRRTSSSIKIPFASIGRIKNTPELQDRPVYVFDDWIISGGQMRHIIEDLDGISEPRFRLIALRDNWKELITEPLCLHGSSMLYYYPADPIDNSIEGPSIVGVHSSPNIGWQNRLATFALDLSCLQKDTPTELPSLGSILRPYRTRQDIPRYYTHPPREDLLSWRYRHGLDPDSFTQFTPQTVRDLCQRNILSDDKSTV